MTLLLLLSALAQAQDAPCTATPEDIDLSLQDAESAYEMGDEPGTTAALKRAELTLPCLSAVLPVPVAARFHRIEGLVAFISGDEMTAAQSFGSARLLEPAYVWPESVIPPGNEMLQVYTAFDVSKVKKLKVPPAPAGSLYIDGQPAKKRAEGMPVLLQLADSTGKVVQTGWVRGEDPLPTWTLPTATATEGAAPAPAPTPAEAPAETPPADGAPAEQGRGKRGR